MPAVTDVFPLVRVKYLTLSRLHTVGVEKGLGTFHAVPLVRLATTSPP